MPPKRKRKVDSQQTASDVGKTKWTRQRTPANLTEQPSESITVSLDKNNNEASQVNFIPPLVENVFNIDAILKDPFSVDQSAMSNDGKLSFGLRIGDDIPPDMMRCSGGELSAHIPHQLKTKIWSHKYFNMALLKG